MSLKISSKKVSKILSFAVFLALFFANFTNNVANATSIFTRDLKIGDENQDVRELQKILNKDVVTVVANTGPGSAGSETTYFGELTRWAIVAFQEKYASEILVPSGLSAGTGFVGPATRAKLNTLVNSVNPISPLIPASIPTSIPVPARVSQPLIPSQPSVTQKISLYNVSKYQVLPGETIDLNGAGFSSGENILHFGDVRTVSSFIPPNLASVSFGRLIKATIPSDLPLGKYEIWITNPTSSKNPNAPVYIFVTNNPLPAPSISNISPAIVSIQDEIIISGSGFSATGNNIYSTLGNILNVPASGTIKIKVSDFPMASNFKKLPAGVSGESTVWFYIQNDGGVTNSPSSFKVRL